MRTDVDLFSLCGSIQLHWKIKVIHGLIPKFSVSDSETGVRCCEDTSMHGFNIPDAIQRGASPSGGVQIWGPSVFGHLLVLVANPGIANFTAATNNGAAESAGSRGCVEGSSNTERYEFFFCRLF